LNRKAPLRALVAALLLSLCLPAMPAFGAEPEQQAALQRRIESLRQTVARYERNLARAQRCDDSALAEAYLQLEKIALLQTRYRPGFFRETMLARLADTAEEVISRLGGPAPAVRSGFHERAYLSDIDLSPQPYFVYVPTSYDGAKPFPVLIFLHGYDYYIDKINWQETMYSPDLEKLGENQGYIVVMPYARSNTEFMGIGEDDVLHVLDLVKKQYRVDDSRVIISGASMGGSGAYTIAAHYPHLFAGVFTITGRVDYYKWMRIEKTALPRFKQVQIDMDYVRDLLRNLRYIPVRIFHGRLDHLLDVGQSRLMNSLLRQLDQPVAYVEFPDDGHYIWSRVFAHATMPDWLKGCVRPAAPRALRHRTYSLKYGRAYWAEIRDFETWGQAAEIRARFDEAGTLKIDTTNVAAVDLALPDGLQADKKPVRVLWRGKRFTTDNGGRLALGKAPGNGTMHKTRAMCGPFREALASRFLIVPGTAGDDQEDAAGRKRAQGAALDWIRWTQGKAVVKPDAAVTEQDIRDNNLILYGSPETNRIVRRIAGRLPIRFEKDAYVVGDRRVPRAGAGLLMIYPNPLNPKRYVAIRDGVRWGATLSINHKYDFVPDFIIYSKDVDRDGTMFESNDYICAGYFDGAWRLSAESTWFNEKRDAEAIP